MQMSDEVKIVSVDADNVEEQGFFCYKSKPKSAGYQQKLAWLMLDWLLFIVLL